MAGFVAWAQRKREDVVRRFGDTMKTFGIIVQYNYVNSIAGGDGEIRLMNYGWIDPANPVPLMPLDAEDEPERYPLQLYHRVAAAVDLRDKDVLEVGSGRGGGAAYIAKYLGPRLIHGVDLCSSSVAFCNTYWKRPCLTFSLANAERLPQSDVTFDAIVNVESSHCYLHFARFAHHAFRVLRPGGYLLFADFRPAASIESVRGDLLKAGFEPIEEEVLNPGVILALDADDARKRAFIEAKVTERRKTTFRVFAGLKGTPTYESFKSGEAVYVRLVFKKPAASPPDR